ncbi:MAG TPA: hypothetical protein VG755_00085 [Nannocystaceae bacterium]|nr:hypothetical protein [Nannocystaceae bacterium]
MSSARLGLAALLLTIACDKQKPQRTAVPSKPQRMAVPKRGQQLIAGDPTPAPELADLFGRAKLVPIATDGVWAGLDPGAETLWIGPIIDRLDDGDSGRNALAIRRAAFGRRVPALGEAGELSDDDELIDAGYANDDKLVLLIGPETQCIAARGRARVIAEVTGGHVLDLRWPVEGCGNGPWAPIGLLVDRQPTQLRWRVAACPEPDAIANAWAQAHPTSDEQWIELGTMTIGDEPYVLVGHDGTQGVVYVAPKAEDGAWTKLTFDAAGLTPIRHGCAPTPKAPEQPEDDATSPRASGG